MGSWELLTNSSSSMVLLAVALWASRLLAEGLRTRFFFDIYKGAIAAIEHNIKALGLGACTTVRQIDFVRGMRQSVSRQADLVFLDPPYDHHELVSSSFECLDKCGRLRSGGLVVLEQEVDDATASPSDDFSLEREKTYGRTKISFWRYQTGAP